MRHSQSFPWYFALVTVALVGALPAKVSASDKEDERPVTTVSRVDLKRYVGLWYEIAKIPNRFQKQCARGTTAEYTLREDGRISVVNRCFKEDGVLDEAEGVAKIVDATNSTKLKVSFVSFAGWRPFWGDYWVIGLDDAYEWAIVGSPSRKYGWVLARNPELDEDTMEEIFAIIERNGYERDAFNMSAQ
jgi:apolipoprotein D and lipocalin family protein